MSERLTDDEYRAWIDAGSPDELEGWAIILALRARVAKLEEALKDIGKQMINAEMDEQQHRYADFEGAYETMIKVARAALKDTPKENENG